MSRQFKSVLMLIARVLQKSTETYDSARRR